ncbi:MAG: hypothetical protein EBX72_11565 [Betaproteobacteria bacterium]|nr:hypothetical protein [Betaproteobacteria bacterium]
MLDCTRCALMTLHRQRILIFAADAPLLGDILCGDAHMDGLKGIGERSKHHIDGAAMSHARAPALGGQNIRPAAHAFSPAADRNVGIAQQNRLGCAHDRLQATAAEAVDVHRSGVLAQTPLDRCNPR